MSRLRKIEDWGRVLSRMTLDALQWAFLFWVFGAGLSGQLVLALVAIWFAILVAYSTAQTFADRRGDPKLPEGIAARACWDRMVVAVRGVRG